MYVIVLLLIPLNPGTNPKNGKPYTNRLYSIASTRYGDDMKVLSFFLKFAETVNKSGSYFHYVREQQQPFV